MNASILCGLLLLPIAAVYSSSDYSDFTSNDRRDWIVSLAIKEAQANQKDQITSQSSPLQRDRIIKRGSLEAVAHSRRYDLYQDMIARAESMLAAESALAESANEESRHSISSKLTSHDLARMWTICCEEVTVVRKRCPPSAQFRTIDGTCNNLLNPIFGAHATVFPRLLPALYENGVDSPRGRQQALGGKPFNPPNPSARQVSLLLHPDRPINDRRLTNLIWQWGQFLDHDITLSPESEVECPGCDITGSCENIRVNKYDPAFGLRTRNQGNCLPFRRSIPACPIKAKRTREQINDLTSFIDGSMIYGSTDRVARALRQFRRGLLKVGPNFPGRQSSLPTITQETKKLVICMGRTDCFLAGDIRANEQTGLLIMHTIWVREHNRCARNIAKMNPKSKDEQIYQLCRKIVGAIIQKITYKDWLPKLYGQLFNKYIGPYRGYNPRINPGVFHAFATASFRFGHSMVQPMFNRLDRNFRPLPIGPLLLRNAFFNPPQFRKSLGTDPILRAMLTGQSRSLDQFIETTLTTRLFQSQNNSGLDLAALNIQRGRDHGLQPYIRYALPCKRIFKVAPQMKRANVARLKKVYGSLKTVDLFVGGLYEVPSGRSIFGPTFACLNGIAFRNMRDGDRFYYEKRGVFTPSQRNSIRKHTLSRILCDNMDDLRIVQKDAFLVPRQRIPCKNIPKFDYRPFRVSTIATDEQESDESILESKMDRDFGNDGMASDWNIEEENIDSNESFMKNEYEDDDDDDNDDYVSGEDVKEPAFQAEGKKNDYENYEESVEEQSLCNILDRTGCGK